MAPVGTVGGARQLLDASGTSEAWPAASAPSRGPASSLALCNQENEDDPWAGAGSGNPASSCPSPGGGFLRAGHWRGCPQPSPLEARPSPHAHPRGGKTGRKTPEQRILEGAQPTLGTLWGCSCRGPHRDPEMSLPSHTGRAHGSAQVAPGPMPATHKRTGFSLTELWGWERGSPTFSACRGWCEAPSFAEWGSEPSSSPQPGLSVLPAVGSFTVPLSPHPSNGRVSVFLPWVLTDG